MKKAIFLGALLLIPSVSLAAFDVNLKYGSKGDTVIELQEFLTDQGVYSGPITGNFYSLTRAAVKRFQIAENITPSAGYFGPISRARAKEILSLDSDEVQEVAETGTTTPPVVTPPVVTITPSAPPATPPSSGGSAPAPLPAPVASQLKVKVQDNEVLGAQCQNTTYKVSILDQYGAEMPGLNVKMLAPYKTETLQTTSENTGDGLRSYAIFQYNTPATSTVEAITFSSGDLTGETTLSVRSGMYGRALPIEGFNVSTSTRLCI